MLIDDLKELLKFIEPDVQTIKNFWKNSKLDEEYAALHEQINQPDFWQHKDQPKISQRFEQVKDQRESYYNLIKNFTVEYFCNSQNRLQSLLIDTKDWLFIKFNQTCAFIEILIDAFLVF